MSKSAQLALTDGPSTSWIDEQLAGLASPAPRSLAAIRARGVTQAPHLECLAPEQAIGHFFRQLVLPRAYC